MYVDQMHIKKLCKFVKYFNFSVEALSGHEPSKHVKIPQDIAKWQRSEAYYDLLGFINAVSYAIQGKRINDPNIYISPTMKNVVGIFDKLNKLVDESPPVDQPTRFGNKGYRVWARKMHRVSI